MKVVVLDIETISMKEWPWASAWIAGVYDEGSQSFHQKEEVLRYYILTGLPDSLSSPWDLGGFVRVGKGFLPRVVYRALKHREQVEALFKGQKVIFPPSSQTLDSLGAFHEDRMLRERLRWADVLVAHNVDFEASILRAHGYPLPDLYCTMRESTNLCGLTRTVYSWGWWDDECYSIAPKWPKLEEAARILLPHCEEEEGYHNPLYDVRVTLRLFLELCVRGQLPHCSHMSHRSGI